MRRAAKIDDNQREIVSLFRDLGYSVLNLSAVGHGCPDIAVGKHGVTYLIEIKDGAKSSSRRKLTADEQAFYDNWRGSVDIIESVNDVLAFNLRNS